MISSKKLLTDLKKQVTLLENDLRQRCKDVPEIDAPLRAQYDAAKAGKRTAMTYGAWLDEQLTQVAVAWVLACVFVRFLEDNSLVEVPKLAGPGALGQRARDEHEMYFRVYPTLSEREYLESVFTETGTLPAMREFFDRRHNPLWQCGPSGDAAAALLDFWRKADPDTGTLVHDFTDPSWTVAGDSSHSKSNIQNSKSSSDSTRFLGDLYQDLSEAARKKYALLQTPEFIEEFILDRTLTPAIDTFGYQVVRLIDPTCGSGHFLLGAFIRLFRLWLQAFPGENPRVLAQNALNAIYGVDLNPYAVAIARFRLLLAALQVCGITKLKNAPDFSIHLASGDSLLHGARFDNEGNPYVEARQELFGGDSDEFKDELKHHYQVEDTEILHRILGQQYHAVVGNPPYITVKDPALNELYRRRYESCYREYALTAPFMERFFDLAMHGSEHSRDVSGFTGQITGNAFMKREFGKKLIEEFIPRWNLTHVIDTSGAYIPAHGTPTVILFGRNSKPLAPTIRAVMGIKGEPGTPPDPAKGKVWGAIIAQIDHAGSESIFVSAVDIERSVFQKHPWALGGGRAGDLKAQIDASGVTSIAKLTRIVGYSGQTNSDEIFRIARHDAFRRKLPSKWLRKFVVGDVVRDFVISDTEDSIFPYSSIGVIDIDEIPEISTLFWPCRTILGNRRTFSKCSYFEDGKPWWGWHQMSLSRLTPPERITFAFVGTHNHFVFARDGHLYNRSAPFLGLAKARTENYIELMGILNSSVACFWMKQVFHCKGGQGINEGAKAELWERFTEFDGTKLKEFPVPAKKPLTLATELDRVAQELSEQSPDGLAARDAVSAASLVQAEQLASSSRTRMIALQEELDWQCYRLYGLIDAHDELEWPEERYEDLPLLTLGERAFEIRMARQIEAGEFETAWFERHKEAGSRPITIFPGHWPDDYRALVERRLSFMESNNNINIIERPEFKRRWNTEPWAKRQHQALQKWLLARLEGYFLEGSRVCKFSDGFDPAAQGFRAAIGPNLQTANQLADVVQSDTRFLEAAEVYVGSRGFSVAKLVRELVEAESVPALPRDRYKDSGLRKRGDWEETWRLQRQEDAVEEGVRSQGSGVSEDGQESESPRSKVAEEDLKKRVRAAQLAQVGDIPVPPKYGSGDFKKASFWKLRGKLDVPKERWISYPGAERDGDTSPVIAWAGWDHLQQAQALAEYFLDAKDAHGWPPAKLKPLLAALADLLPWLKQWHNTFDPNFGMGLGDYFQGFLEEQCRLLETTVEEVDKGRFSG